MDLATIILGSIGMVSAVLVVLWGVAVYKIGGMKHCFDDPCKPPSGQS